MRVSNASFSLISCSLLLASLFWLTDAAAQTVKYYTGERVSDPALGKFDLFNYDQNRLYVFRSKDGSKGKIYHLETFSRDSLIRLSLIKIPFPDEDSVDFHLENLFVRDFEYLIFYSFFDKKSRMEKLDMIRFNRAGEKLGETKTIDYSAGKNERKAGSFSVFNRSNENEFLSYSTKESRDSTYISIDHFDYEGTKTRSQHFILTEDFGNPYYSIVDSAGGLIFLTSGKSRRDNKWNLKVFTPDSRQPVVIPLPKISFRDYYISSKVRSFYDAKRRWNIVAPYSESAGASKSLGLYHAQFDLENFTLVGEAFIPFQSAENNLEGNDRAFSMSSCIPLHIFTQPDGGFNVVFESRLRTTTTMYGAAINETYEIGDIFSVLIDGSYHVKSMCLIPKEQKVNETNVKYSGFVMLHKDNSCYYLYNELPVNLNAGPGSHLKKVKNSRVDDTSIILTRTEDNKITERKILVEKSKPDVLDALLPYETLHADDEVYALRKIDNDNYLMKFFFAK